MLLFLAILCEMAASFVMISSLAYQFLVSASYVLLRSCTSSFIQSVNNDDVAVVVNVLL